jgi:hypothetical protein
MLLLQLCLWLCLWLTLTLRLRLRLRLPPVHFQTPEQKKTCWKQSLARWERDQ